jgi:hypothetical protein
MRVYGQLHVPSQVGEITKDGNEKQVITLKTRCSDIHLVSEHRATPVRHTELFSSSNLPLDFPNKKKTYDAWRDLNHFVSALPCFMSQKRMNLRKGDEVLRIVIFLK